MADYTVAFSELDSLLQGLPANTTSTPYSILITDWEPSDIHGGYESTGPLGDILLQNSTKYVDLSENDFSTAYDSSNIMGGAFQGCTSLIYGPTVPTQMYDTFIDCTNLVSLRVHYNYDAANSYLYEFGIDGAGDYDFPFDGCSSLTDIYVNSDEDKADIVSFCTSYRSSISWSTIVKVVPEPIPPVVPKKTIASAFIARNAVSPTSSSLYKPDQNLTIIQNQSGGTVTLGQAAYPGLEVTIQVFARTFIEYTTVGSAGSMGYDVVDPYTKLVYTWTGSAWFCSSCPVAIGDVYTQMPDTKEPYLMYGGRWEEHSYGGMFFRSQGGNAHAFVPSIAGTFSSATVFVASSSLPASVVVGDLVVSDSQYATITAISGTTITIDTAITNWSNKTNLLIGQFDMFQAHRHELNGVGGQHSVQTGTYWSVWTPNESGTYKKMGAPYTYPGYGTPRYGSETRSQNITIRYWLRQA